MILKNTILLATLFFVINATAQIKNTRIPRTNVSEDKDVTEYNKYVNRVNKEEVWFYENAHYSGKKYILTRGFYSLKQLGMNANDFFSSAIIPPNLFVMVFADDNNRGNCYLLRADEVNKKYNVNFSKVEIAVGKDIGGQTLKGTQNLNDNISSILIYDCSLDGITLYEDCAYKRNSYTLHPGPNINHNDFAFYNYNSKEGWGWNNMTDFKMNDKISSIELFGNLYALTIYQEVNMKGYEKIFTNNIACLKNVGLTTTGSFISDNSNWNDRLSSITIRMKPGPVTIEN